MTVKIIDETVIANVSSSLDPFNGEELIIKNGIVYFSNGVNIHQGQWDTVKACILQLNLDNPAIVTINGQLTVRENFGSASWDAFVDNKINIIP